MGYKVFIDFEMAPIDRKYNDLRKICRMEIIQVGAVMLDDNDAEVSDFKRNVRPLYISEIPRRYRDLLGISLEELKYRATFDEILKDFEDWVVSYDADATIYAWSDSDLNQVTKECEMKDIEFDDVMKHFIENWIDLQLEYDNTLKPESGNQTGLAKALELCGIEFEGKQHDSLIDSRNTAQVYRELKDKEHFLELVRKRNEYIGKREEMSCTLGDLFDFSKFSFS